MPLTNAQRQAAHRERLAQDAKAFREIEKDKENYVRISEHYGVPEGMFTQTMTGLAPKSDVQIGELPNGFYFHASSSNWIVIKTDSGIYYRNNISTGDVKRSECLPYRHYAAALRRLPMNLQNLYRFTED